MSALLTDLYQLTMLQGYLEQGKGKNIATFDLYFRTNPFKGGFAICAGLEPALQAVLDLRFSEDDLDYLANLKGAAGTPLFREPFLKYLSGFRFRGKVRGLPEGSVAFPNLPLLQVQGGILEAQLVETLLLCHMGYQSLIATRTTRLKGAARNASIIEFGLRRAQGPNGALAGARAMYVGGGDGTSNVLAGKLFGIPVRGTQAHSWVMAFDSELEAFRAYAHSYPDDCILLVDTYDTLNSGLPNAIQVARELRKDGHEMVGIRLDSGDFTYLSIRARAMLDEAGFPNVKILASNDLDEALIEDLLRQGARIDIWGVGTRLIAALGEGGGALGCVYKLVALNGEPRIKRSSQVAKMTNPGLKDAVRLFDANGSMEADALVSQDEVLAPGQPCVLVDPSNPAQKKVIEKPAEITPLLKDYIVDGEQVTPFPTLDEIRAHRARQIALLHPSYKRILNPHIYKVGLSERLWSIKKAMIDATHPPAEKSCTSYQT